MKDVLRRARVLLILPTATYRALDFLEAARSLDVGVVVASEVEQTIPMGDRALVVDLCDPVSSAERIAAVRPDAVIGVDEQGVELAAHASAMLGHPHNPPEAVAVTRDKARMREVLSAAGLEQPTVGTEGDGPKVVKAPSLSGSRGVIRADGPEEIEAAIGRVRAILAEAGEDGDVIVESYVPGAEVAVEGLLRRGELFVLAVFDKPDPLEGPYFEETIYVTPSRLPLEVRDEVIETVSAACSAIGLVEGPIHAEVRLPPGRPPVLLEVAARSIGGLCSRTLRFGAGISLEGVILRHALGLELGPLERQQAASGVMMIPIPSSGVLRSVGGLEEARAIDGVAGVEITVPVGHEVRALPEGDRYLGFIFASATTPANVEATLRDAFNALRVEIDPTR